MPARSPKSSRIIRKAAGEVPPRSAADLARLRAARKRPIDTSEIPEQTSFTNRVRRDADGRLPRRSLVREAVQGEMERRKLTVYRVWKDARPFCTTLSQSAVSEFLKGQRELELPYAEALLRALGLTVARGGTHAATVK